MQDNGKHLPHAPASGNILHDIAAMAEPYFQSLSTQDTPEPRICVERGAHLQWLRKTPGEQLCVQPPYVRNEDHRPPDWPQEESLAAHLARLNEWAMHMANNHPQVKHDDPAPTPKAMAYMADEVFVYDGIHRLEEAFAACSSEADAIQRAIQEAYFLGCHVERISVRESEHLIDRHRRGAGKKNANVAARIQEEREQALAAERKILAEHPELDGAELYKRVGAEINLPLWTVRRRLSDA